MLPADLLAVLKFRFEAHPQRHPGLAWAAVQARLAARAEAAVALVQMEATGGEPDVIGQDDGALLFADCAAESPAGRRSLCYDRAALDARKANKPAGCVSDQVAAMGVVLMSEAQYHALQALGEFDLRSSSWVATPPGLRARGGALFCDRRYGRVFTYHNGADSYYAARGFRTLLRV
ncbi:DUF4256 domain-containing protein [Piscinibacter sakaiensis]|uniref:DUF4256 domain-containing protein n=1 Tax=Piscinibacter sakaiensis TaxID=1547922 RepID=A0A0K8NX73_PISS1|nr:DUF4256 domain-containing protein [Piscinibacter sakaiensis]GAP35002.1 hypothetical protein ISF6_0567 [Piscinibacter sakaiensis]